jgi:hypothetical protein
MDIHFVPDMIFFFLTYIICSYLYDFCTTTTFFYKLEDYTHERSHCCNLPLSIIFTRNS